MNAYVARAGVVLCDIARGRGLSSVVPVAVPVLVGVLVAQAAWAVAATSGTFDETTYLQLGLDVYRAGRFDGLSALGVAPLPVLLCYALPALVNPSQQAFPTMYASLITAARASSIVLIGVPLVLIVYLWLARQAGRWTGLVGAALVALSPNIVAHVSIATADACFTVCALIALAALTRYVETRSTGALLVLAITLGLALAAKYSGAALFAVVAAVLFVAPGPRGAKMSGTSARAIAAGGVTIGLFAAAVCVVWALHGFAVRRAVTPAFVPDYQRVAGTSAAAGSVLRLLERVQVPAPVRGMIVQINHARAGHPAFLMGEVSRSGWWYYMPVALALKSTPAELLVILAGVWIFSTKWREDTPSVLVWRSAFLVYGGLGLLGRLDLGVRYVLLLVPLAILGTCDRFGRARAHRPTVQVLAAAALVLVQASSTASIAPYYLSYFNRFAGGPAEGYRYLADSNLDWGQDLPALRQAFEVVGAKRPLLSYFGTAPIEAYGLSATMWRRGMRPDPAAVDWIAISATDLDGVYLQTDPFWMFRRLRPSARAAYSIFLYSVDRADVLEAMAAATSRLQE